MLAIALLAWPPAAAAGAATSTPRAIVVTIDGSDLDDWSDDRLSTLGRILTSGAAGLLSVRPTADDRAFFPRRTDAYRVLSKSRGDTALRASLLRGALPGAEGMEADRVRRIPERPDQRFPTGSRTDYERLGDVLAQARAESDVVVVELPDVMKVVTTTGLSPGAREALVDESMAAADRFLSHVLATTEPSDLVVVAALAGPPPRTVGRGYLSVVAMTGPGVARGRLTSQTTRRGGLVALIDVAPTIARHVGRPVEGMLGRPITVQPDSNPEDTLHTLETRLAHAAAVRKPILKTSVLSLAALLLALTLTVLATDSPKFGGTARRAATLLSPVAVVGAAVPAAIFLEPVYGQSALSRAGPAVALASAGLGLAAYLLTRNVLVAIAALGALQAALILGDVVLGGSLASSSPLSFLLGEGARFFGIGNEAMGLVIGGIIVAAGVAVSRGASPAPAVMVPATVATVVMITPDLGAKLGAIPTAIPAFAVLWLLAGRRRLTPRSALIVAGLVAVAVAGVLLLDSARGGEGAHGAAAVRNQNLLEILGRKVGVALRLLRFSYWAFGLAAALGALLLVMWRARRAGSMLPVSRLAAPAGLTAAALAILTNDAGLTAATWIAIPLALVALAEARLSPGPGPDRPGREPSARRAGVS